MECLSVCLSDKNFLCIEKLRRYDLTDDSKNIPVIIPVPYEFSVIMSSVIKSKGQPIHVINRRKRR